MKRGPVVAVVGIPAMLRFDPRANAATDAALEQMRKSKPLAPPHRRRNWQEAASPRAANCNECGRLIVPHEQHFADLVSGHLVRHVGCHEAAEKREARR